MKSMKHVIDAATLTLAHDIMLTTQEGTQTPALKGTPVTVVFDSALPEVMVFTLAMPATCTNPVGFINGLEEIGLFDSGWVSATDGPKMFRDWPTLWTLTVKQLASDRRSSERVRTASRRVAVLAH